MAEERVRIEIGFEGGTIMGAQVPLEDADGSSASSRPAETARSRSTSRTAPASSSLASSTSSATAARVASGSAASGGERAGMALEVGIVGLPNAGKTTLFNALTSRRRDNGLRLGGDEAERRHGADRGRTPRAGRGRRQGPQGDARRPSASSTCPAPARRYSETCVRSTRCSRSPTASRRTPTRQATSRRSGSSCSSPTESTSSGGSSGSRSRRSRATRGRRPRSPSSSDSSRRSTADVAVHGGEALPPELEPLTTKPLIEIVNGRAGSTRSSRPSSRSSRRRRREASERVRRRSTWVGRAVRGARAAVASSPPLTRKPGRGRGPRQTALDAATTSTRTSRVDSSAARSSAGTTSCDAGREPKRRGGAKRLEGKAYRSRTATC